MHVELDVATGCTHQGQKDDDRHRDQNHGHWNEENGSNGSAPAEVMHGFNGSDLKYRAVQPASDIQGYGINIGN